VVRGGDDTGCLPGTLEGTRCQQVELPDLRAEAGGNLLHLARAVSGQGAQVVGLARPGKFLLIHRGPVTYDEKFHLTTTSLMEKR
jgi:hypothetical protein